jgi:hypothetical protein
MLLQHRLQRPSTQSRVTACASQLTVNVSSPRSPRPVATSECDASLPGDLHYACFEGESAIAGCYIFSDIVDKYRVFVTSPPAAYHELSSRIFSRQRRDFFVGPKFLLPGPRDDRFPRYGRSTQPDGTLVTQSFVHKSTSRTGMTLCLGSKSKTSRCAARKPAITTLPVRSDDLPTPKS